MPLSKIEDVRQLNDTELSEQIEAVKRDLFNLRLQQVTRATDARPKPHQYKHLKHRLAQMMTVERERQLAALANGVQATLATDTPDSASSASASASASEEE